MQSLHCSSCTPSHTHHTTPHPARTHDSTTQDTTPHHTQLVLYEHHSTAQHGTAHHTTPHPAHTHHTTPGSAFPTFHSMCCLISCRIFSLSPPVEKPKAPSLLNCALTSGPASGSTLALVAPALVCHGRHLLCNLLQKKVNWFLMVSNRWQVTQELLVYNGRLRRTEQAVQHTHVSDAI